MASIKHKIEYGALLVVSGLVNALPERIALLFGWLLAAFSHYVLRFRRAESIRRIQQVMGDGFTRAECARISWLAWRNTCFTAVEIMRMAHLTKESVEKNTELADLDLVMKELRPDRGAVLATPHIGNWERGGVSSALFGMPFFFIARRQKNELTNALLNRRRGVTGIETIMSDDQRMLLKVVKRLKRGMVFAILPDVRSRVPALNIQFLHHPANIASGMAVFSRLAKVPVIPMYAIRIGWTRHAWHTLKPVYPDFSLSRDDDALRMTQLVMDQFTEIVLKHPDQYFWFNKRWVLEPLDDE